MRKTQTLDLESGMDHVAIEARVGLKTSSDADHFSNRAVKLLDSKEETDEDDPLEIIFPQEIKNLVSQGKSDFEKL